VNDLFLIYKNAKFPVKELTEILLLQKELSKN